MANRRELEDSVLQLRDLLVARATGEANTYEAEDAYLELREELTRDPRVKDRIPTFVRRHRSLGEFWSFIKGEAPSYEGRRVFLRAQFAPVLEYLEFEARQAGDDDISEALSVLSSEHVQAAWAKALERRESDPEGAITAARTLVETVCKHILDEAEVEYDDGADLPALYHLTAMQLNLSPSQHTEVVFKQILGSAQAIVNGLGAVRNRLSDSHGRGKAAVKPAPRHATLAVNMAGSVAAFLVETWEIRR